MKDDNSVEQSVIAVGVWVRLASLAALEKKGRLVVKIERKQLALFLINQQIFACNNRCPHEGYPLSEGHFTDGCILTCNWHNWKFDLSSGDTLVGGDALTVYQTRLDGDDIFVAITEPSPQEVTEKALHGLRQSFDLHEYDRMAREIARLIQVGADPQEALRNTIAWTYEHFEFGTTHAVAVTADWLALIEKTEADPAERLTAIVESVAHFAWDTRREPKHSYTIDSAPYDADELLDAIEAEDESRAVPLVRGAFESGLGYSDIEPTLVRSALAHYQDFGHSLIYVYKTGQLIARLADADTALRLTLMLVRSLIYASREDLIPEFKSYRLALENWPNEGAETPIAEQLVTGRLTHVLDAISQGAVNIDATYDAVMQAVGWQLLHYDTSYQQHVDKSVSQNVTWLGLTHALTFGNAVRKMCDRYPDLWPQGLLQIGCFLGRNSAFVDADLDGRQWHVADVSTFLRDNMAGLYDHGHPELIVSGHLLKVLIALDEEVREKGRSEALTMLVAGVNRFLNTPLKRKHALRTANQAISMVASEG